MTKKTKKIVKKNYCTRLFPRTINLLRSKKGQAAKFIESAIWEKKENDQKNNEKLFKVRETSSD